MKPMQKKTKKNNKIYRITTEKNPDDFFSFLLSLLSLLQTRFYITIIECVLSMISL